MGLALVVEDDPHLHSLIGTVLEEALDEQIVQCDSAEAAIAVLDDCGREFDVMVTDIELTWRVSPVAGFRR